MRQPSLMFGIPDHIEDGFYEGYLYSEKLPRNNIVAPIAVIPLTNEEEFELIMNFWKEIKQNG